jgi:uncharacterized membrane protein YeiB
MAHTPARRRRARHAPKAARPPAVGVRVVSVALADLLRRIGVRGPFEWLTRKLSGSQQGRGRVRPSTVE